MGNAGLSIDWCPPQQLEQRLSGTQVDSIICFPNSVAERLELEGWIGEIAQGCGSDVHLIFVEGAQTQPSKPDKSEVATMHYDVEALVCLLRDTAHPTPVPVDFDETPVPFAIRSAPSPYAELAGELV